MFISIDLGGTKTRVASTTDLERIYKEETFLTSQNLLLEQKNLLDAMAKVSDSKMVEGICVGLPGLIDKKKKIFENIINVKALSGLSYAELFANKFSSEIIVVENDAALAGLGEAVYGAGKDYDVVAYLTLSTGVGGVRIANKKIASDQKISEPGHMLIKDSEKEFSLCGQRGCFAYYSSGTGFEENYGISSLTCEDQQIWDDYAKNLARGVINTIAMWGPDVIVLGGSMTNVYEKFYKKGLFEELSKQKLFKIPPIEIFSLGDNAGILGGFIRLAQS